MRKLGLQLDAERGPSSLAIVHRNEAAGALIDRLLAVQRGHMIWRNPLLVACEAERLTREDFRYLFGQYYYYSRNFTKMLAAALVNCDNDLHRSQLTANLWEESGQRHLEERHAELFRRFLLQHLNIDTLEDLEFEPHSIAFFENSLAACLHGTSLQAAAFLSFGTEGIVPELYRIFTKGLLAAGLSEEALQFFMIHLECDDDHAQTLQDMALFYLDAPDWYEVCERAMVQALDIRDRFFSSVFQSLRPRAFDDLVRRISLASAAEDEIVQRKVRSVRQQNTPLYRNTDSHQGIMFEVERIAVGAEVLDPRVLTIPAGRRNESHRHAHETLMLVLSGRGEVYLGETPSAVTRDDVVFVPRWVPHHTRNTGSDDLRILAITDFELTSRFPGNTEESYRAR